MADDLVKRLRARRMTWVGAEMDPDRDCREAADRIEALEAEIAAVTSVVEDCTIDLRGAGYDCVRRDGEYSIGAYREGKKVLCEGRRVHLSGLSIFGPVRIKEMEDALAAEKALADRLWAQLRVAEAALSDIGDADREEGDDLAWCEARAAKAIPETRAAIAAYRKARGL